MRYGFQNGNIIEWYNTKISELLAYFNKSYNNHSNVLISNCNNKSPSYGLGYKTSNENSLNNLIRSWKRKAVFDLEL